MRDSNNKSIENNSAQKSSKEWQDFSNKKVIKLFQDMAKRVPAYKDFLAKNSVSAGSIKTIDDFKKIPPVDKDNYLRRYPLSSLCWDGDLKGQQWVISTTSGSTGQPFYFPRTDFQDRMYAETAEQYLLNNFSIDKHSTLYIDGFAMGAWIGGLFTYQAIRHVAMSGNYKLSIITPGIFKHEIIKAVVNMGNQFDQIIIGGYPPMIKDMIDDAIEEGVNWADYNVKFIFSAEGFSEKFRDYIVKKAKLGNVYTSTLNHYGSVDLGTMAHETPLSIYLRRLTLQDKSLYSSFFSDINKLPTFAQYDPAAFYFEEVNEALYCSSYSGLPLVRYDLKDRGGIYTYDQVSQKLRDNNIDLLESVNSIDLGRKTSTMPFVYVYERSDFIVKLYGANIYPETIRKALLNVGLSNYLTGKFTAEISYDSSHNQYLEVHVELKHGKRPTITLEKRTQDIIVKCLLRENSEFRSNFKESPGRQRPKITLWEYESPTYFMPGVKQKWVKK